MKYQRTWTATIQVSDTDTVTVSYPLTIIFNVSRNTLASANTGSFRIFNLSEKNRLNIFHDRFDTATYRQIMVMAGYQGEPKLPTIFQGNILSAYSYREGVNWITEIEALDGGFGIINGQVSTPIPAGYSFRELFQSTVQTMEHIGIGDISDFTSNSTRGVTLYGNSWDILNRITPKEGTPFVDLEKANILKDEDYLNQNGLIDLITSETGLLATPRRGNKTLEVPILFEPRLIVGQIIKLESLEQIYNGTYKIIGIAHRATISEAIGGEAVTAATLFAPEALKAAA